MRRKTFVLLSLAEAVCAFGLPLKMELEPVVQVSAGGASESVFSNGTVFSRLDWDEKAACSLGGKISLTAGKFFLGAECFGSIPQKSGFLRDFDFMNGDASITHYSIHDCHLESNVNFSFRAGAEIALDRLTVSPFAAFEFFGAKWSGKDGHLEYYQYPSSEPCLYPAWNGPNFSGKKEPCEGTIIDYEQKLFCPSLGLKAKLDISKRLSAGFDFSFSPYAFGFAEDSHWLRSIRFRDELRGGKMISCEFSLSLAASKKTRISVSAGSKSVLPMQGDTSTKKTGDSQWGVIVGSKGGAKRDFSFLRLSAVFLCDFDSFARKIGDIVFLDDDDGGHWWAVDSILYDEAKKKKSKSPRLQKGKMNETVGKNESAATWQYERDARGNVTHAKCSDGTEYWYDYDKNGNLSHWKNNAGVERWFECDARGNVIHETGSDSEEIWYKYVREERKKRTIVYKRTKVR